MIVRLEQARRRVEADRLQADVLEVGPPSRRDQQCPTRYLPPAVQVDSDPVTARLDRQCPALQPELDALALQYVAQHGARLGLLHGEHPVHALDDRALDSKTRENL